MSPFALSGRPFALIHTVRVRRRLSLDVRPRPPSRRAGRPDLGAVPPLNRPQRGRDLRRSSVAPQHHRFNFAGARDRRSSSDRRCSTFDLQISLRLNFRPPVPELVGRAKSWYLDCGRGRGLFPRPSRCPSSNSRWESRKGPFLIPWMSRSVALQPV
jgi:hypothetical protein